MFGNIYVKYVKEEEADACLKVPLSVVCYLLPAVCSLLPVIYCQPSAICCLLPE
jgi:hypothetical protein